MPKHADQSVRTRVLRHTSYTTYTLMSVPDLQGSSVTDRLRCCFECRASRVSQVEFYDCYHTYVRCLSDLVHQVVSGNRVLAAAMSNPMVRQGFQLHAALSGSVALEQPVFNRKMSLGLSSIG